VVLADLVVIFLFAVFSTLTKGARWTKGSFAKPGRFINTPAHEEGVACRCKILLLTELRYFAR
jgi:hypothetical protein